MQYHNKEITYTPEIVTIERGVPIKGVVISESITEFGIELSDGSIVKAEKRLCEIAND